MTKEDNEVMLACLLTGIMRRSLPRAPAFSFDAPAAGSGEASGWHITDCAGPGPQVLEKTFTP